MNDLVLFYFILLIIFGGFYFIIITTFTIGWFSLKQLKDTTQNYKTQVSILVPARNEENNITGLLSNLIHQNYPGKLFEIIVIDDHSTDQTASMVNKFISGQKASLSSYSGTDKNDKAGQWVSIKLIRIKGENQARAYKKKAIRTAIEKSSGNLIITTDAD